MARRKTCFVAKIAPKKHVGGNRNLSTRKSDHNVCTPPQLQGDDDGLHDDEDSELEYDALNDETFGGAIKGNWEDLHENLVQLDRTRDTDDEDLADLTGLTSNKHSGEGNRNDFFSLGESLSFTSRNLHLPD